MEILSPSGSLESLKAAICGGANAVYLGLPRFNARQKAENFSYENFSEVVTYCHLRHVKIYVAINTIIKENEIDDCLCDVNFVISNRADGIIIQDMFLAKLIHEYAPDFPIHLSTQCGICSVEGAKLAKELGATRIVLARETPISEIERIHKNVDIEIEYFVQGALCVSYSGNCYFSSIIDGNSGNRGRCAQPCRKKMKLICGDKIVDGYNLSPKDLSFYKNFQKLIDAGVTSFKIEGRLRSPEYVYFATKLYSQLSNKEAFDETTFDKLMTSFNRGDYSDGYLFGRKSKVIYNKIQSNIGLEVGKIIKVTDKKVIVSSKFVPKLNDGFKITRNNYEVGGGIFLKNCQLLRDCFELCAKDCKIGDVVRLTNSNENQTFVESLSDKIKIKIEYEIKLNKQITITAKLENLSYNYESNYCPQEAITSSLTQKELESQLLRLNDTQFVCDDICGELDENVFLAKSQINALRRQTIEGLLNKFIEYDNKLFAKAIVLNPKHANHDKRTNLKCVIVNELNYCLDFVDKFDVIVFKPFDYSMENILKFEKINSKEKYLYVPNFISQNDTIKIDKILDNFHFDGIYSDGYNGIEIAKRHNLNVFLGTNCNISNSLIENCDFSNQKYYALSKELNQNELNKLNSNAFVLVFGGFSVMNFVHCPLINADICNCNDCKFKNVKYIDSENREFILAKTKIDGCFFSMLNNVSVDIEERINQNVLFDLSFFDENKTAELLLNSSANTSKGHFNRGVK